MMRNATAWRSNGVQATCFLAVSHSESPPSSSFVVRSSLASDQLSILGLTASASKSDVKHAYKRLALKYHPDVIERQNKRPDRFKEIKAAYESLMIKFDDEKEEYVIEAGEKGYYADDYDEWEEWMGFEGGMPVVYNPC